MKPITDIFHVAPMFSAIPWCVTDPGFFTVQVGVGSRRAALEEET